MAAPFAKGFSTAYKRARSQDSPTPLASPPVPKATKIEEETTQDAARVPAFLRQSTIDIRTKFNDLAWKEKLRIFHGRGDPTSRWVQDMNPYVSKRNRYQNVQPWEKSRIHLKVAEGKSDYINASPISLRDPRTGIETNYIATQGPKLSGLSHFWHMIWQETKDVAVIVMLTQTHDGALEKCSQYFPLNIEAGAFTLEPIDQEGGTSEGSVTFLETHSDPTSKTQVRRLSLAIGQETRDVWHFLFSGWPDFSLPEEDDRTALFELLRLSAEKNGSPSNPRIIHCSAGVGRSGTFIALEYLLAQVESGAIADVKDSEDTIYDTVNCLREQRMMMVQMDTQFQFLYDVVRDQYEQWQLASKVSHTPKLRKLASGLKAASVNEAGEDEGFLNDGKVDKDQNREIQETKFDKGHVDETTRKGQDSHST